MSDSPSSVPQVPRPVAHAGHTPLKFPSRYRYRFPPPDEEPYDGVNQVEFAAKYFAAVFVLFIGMAGFAAFVLVPLVGQFMSG